jgi:hypothetical protein
MPRIITPEKLLEMLGRKDAELQLANEEIAQLQQDLATAVEALQRHLRQAEAADAG